MDTSYYVIASLLGAALMVAEHSVARARGIRAYRFDDTVNSLSNFVGELVLTAVLYLNVFYGYALLESHFGLFELDTSHWITWVASFLALDLIYYVGHRACHRVAALWALHTVHHQSNEYNLAVGLRGPMLSALQIAPFMIPLAVAGVPTEVLFPLYAVHTVWKLVVHTRLVGKLGPLEWLFITPSQHRVHHGRDAGYLDRNFGGVLNVWDRLFGTFVVEGEEPSYGPLAGLDNLDPLHNNVQPWREIAERARGEGLRGWLVALFGPPAFEAPPAAERPSTPPISDDRGHAVLVLRLFGAAVITLLMLQFAERVPFVVAAAVGIAVMTTLASVGRALTRGNGRSHSPARPCGASRTV
jgi:sterol desaturase/sphingolipid hydroxylase (fatty acid hydroxylase superfamily)